MFFCIGIFSLSVPNRKRTRKKISETKVRKFFMVQGRTLIEEKNTAKNVTPLCKPKRCFYGNLRVKMKRDLCKWYRLNEDSKENCNLIGLSFPLTTEIKFENYLHNFVIQLQVIRWNQYENSTRNTCGRLQRFNCG